MYNFNFEKNFFSELMPHFGRLIQKSVNVKSKKIELIFEHISIPI